jgi:CHAT domain-containing protein/tetratricopeptide (TPR) repeat protein
MHIRVSFWGTVFGISFCLIFMAGRARPFFSDPYKCRIADAERAAPEGRFESARALFQSAYLQAQRNGNLENQANCLIRSAIMAWNMGKMAEATGQFEGASKLLLHGKGNDRDFCEAALRISDWYNQGKNRRDSGEVDQAIALFRAAVRISRSIGSPELEVKCLRQLSICYWEKNELEKYFELNSAARDIAHSICHRREEGICLNNMGTYYWRTNDYSRALESYDTALNLFRVDGTSENISSCLSNLSVLYKTFSDYEKAIFYAEKAASEDEKSTNMNNLCIDFNNLGVLYKNRAALTGKMRDFLNASIFLRRSSDLAKKINNRTLEMKVLNNIGDLFLAMGKMHDARVNFQKAISLAYILKELEESYSILNNIGLCALKEKNIEEARCKFLSTIKNESQIINSEILEEAYYGLGQCYEIRNQDEKALACYKKCAAIIDVIRGRIRIDSFKSGFVRPKLGVYQSLLNLLVKMRRHNSTPAIDEEIFLYIEKAKARSFLDSLAESRVDITQRLDPRLKEEEGRISRRISAITVSLAGLAADSLDRKALLLDLTREEESYLRLSSRMRTADPAVASLISPEIGTADEIRRRLLGQDDVLFEYFLAEPASLLAVVEKDRMELHVLPSKSDLVNSVKGFIKYLSSRTSSNGELRPAARRIFGDILFPLREGSLAAKKRLIIVPDGILYFLPFEALVDEGWKDGNRFLVERYEISYVPSATTLKWLVTSPSPPPPSEGLLALGDPEYERPHGDIAESLRIPGDPWVREGIFEPLPKSREEIRTIAGYFPKHRRKVFLGAEAREEILKNSNGHRFSVVHLACHSYIDENHPFRSALVFSAPRSEGEDGFLQVRELYNLRLPADLVVLSACRTASGLMDSWEGVLGMPRIFFYTGARSVVSTLWPIEDRSTAFFMDRFYGGMSRGLSKSKSLQRAKIDMLHAGYADPHYWAPFILSGDTRSSIGLKN